MQTSNDPSSRQQTDQANTRSELRLSLVCPACGAAGWLKWSSLRRMIGCPKCHHQFLISRSGELRDRDDLPQVRYKCPRCGRADSIPALLGVRGAACGACRLPLAPGPDQRLHSVDEAARLQRAARQAKQQEERRAKLHSLTVDRTAESFRSLIRWTAAAAGAALLLAGLVASLSYLGPGSETRLPRRFTYACLTGKPNDALAFVGEDPVQQVEFDRWRGRHFTSIADAHRPDGDDVTVEIEILSDEPLRRLYRVSMTSPFVGTREHNQWWRQANGEWLFDAVGTLAETDKPNLRR